MNQNSTIKFNFLSELISVSTFSSFLRNLQVTLRSVGKEIPDTSVDFSNSNAPSLFISRIHTSQTYEIEIKFSYQNDVYALNKSELIFNAFLSKTFESCENSAQRSLWGTDVVKNKASNNKSNVKPDSTAARIIEFVDHLKRMGDSDMIIKDKKLSIRNKFASLL